jgi:hypothetical protein
LLSNASSQAIKAIKINKKKKTKTCERFVSEFFHNEICPLSIYFYCIT